MSDQGNQTGNWGGYDQKLNYVTQLGAGVLELLDAQPGEKILDAGGGTGKQAKDLLDKGVDVTLIDNAQEQVDKARGLLGDRAVLGDVEKLPREWTGKFDAVYSNAVFHYLRDPEKAFAEIARVLKNGGRLVAEMGGSFTQNVLQAGQSNLYVLQNAIRMASAYMPGTLAPLVRTDAQFANMDGIEYIYHPTVKTVAATLEEAGLDVNMARLFRRPTPLEVGQLSAALKGYTSNYTASLTPEQREDFLGKATMFAEQKLPRDKDGKVVLDYVRLQIVATKWPRG